MNVKEALKSVFGPFYSAVRSIPSIVREPTCYPERVRKNAWQRYFELLAYRFRRKCVNIFYTAYGCDTRSWRENDAYVNELEFWTKIVSQNYTGKTDHTIILRDKSLFQIFMSAYGIPTPKVLAYTKGGRFFIAAEEVQFDDWVAHLKTLESPIFLKDTSACCGRNIYKIAIENGQLFCDGHLYRLQKQMFSSSDYIVQGCVINHPDIARIYPRSLNTARLITAWDPRSKMPVLFTQFFRAGANGNVVDNWAVGGLLFSISDHGEVGPYGFYKNQHYAKQSRERSGLRVSSHPETGVSFKGIKLPDYDKALEMVIRVHTFLPSVKSIGWDVAFTPDGPVLIEGNDDWEIAPAQIVSGGLRRRAQEIFGL